MATAAIRTQSLTKIYQSRQIALNCVDLVVEPGTVLAVLGQNGAGKTTLVKLLLGLQLPTAGKVEIFGQRMTPNAGLLRQRIGYVPAIPRFPAGMSPIQYLDLIGRLQGMPRRTRRPRLVQMLRAADLQRVSGTAIQQLSTGMRSRLAIAASLINDPELLIWDEPAQGLDPESRRSMLQLLQQLAEAKTLVVCSHHLHDIQQVCTQAILLHEGQVVYNGELDSLKAAPTAADVTIELVGERKEIAEALKAIQQTEELESAVLARTTLKVKLLAGASMTGALVNVLVMLQDKSIEVADLRIAGEGTESAIANLLREEGSRGLTRAYQPTQG
jgi:ABC-2 type transport system ATP-binding protein